MYQQACPNLVLDANLALAWQTLSCTLGVPLGIYLLSIADVPVADSRHVHCCILRHVDSLQGLRAQILQASGY